MWKKNFFLEKILKSFWQLFWEKISCFLPRHRLCDSLRGLFSRDGRSRDDSLMSTSQNATHITQLKKCFTLYQNLSWECFFIILFLSCSILFMNICKLLLICFVRSHQLWKSNNLENKCFLICKKTISNFFNCKLGCIRHLLNRILNI